ncbi:MAG: DUF1761 domain-containing protein [bacterium]
MNILGIFLGVVLNFIVARVWYGVLFNDLWRYLTDRTPDEKPDKIQMLVAVFFAFLMSFGANIMVSALGITTYSMAVIGGLIFGFMFIAPVILSEWIWDKKNFVLVSINAGFYVLYFVLMFLMFVFIS